MTDSCRTVEGALDRVSEIWDEALALLPDTSMTLNVCGFIFLGLSFLISQAVSNSLPGEW